MLLQCLHAEEPICRCGRRKEDKSAAEGGGHEEATDQGRGQDTPNKEKGDAGASIEFAKLTNPDYICNERRTENGTETQPARILAEIKWEKRSK